MHSYQVQNNKVHSEEEKENGNKKKTGHGLVADCRQRTAYMRTWISPWLREKSWRRENQQLIVRVDKKPATNAATTCSVGWSVDLADSEGGSSRPRRGGPLPLSAEFRGRTRSRTRRTCGSAAARELADARCACFVSFRFGSVRFGSVRFGSVRFGSFRFVSFRFVSFRSVPFRFVSFRFAR